MEDVFDVAEYVLQMTDCITTMKLQKLVFYSHAYSLVHYGSPLVPGHFEAWRNGPVLPELFQAHKGKFLIAPGEIKKHASPLCDRSMTIVKLVVKCLGQKTGRELSVMTHSEDPWKDARGTLDPSSASNAQIGNVAIREFYSTKAIDNPLFQ